MVIVKKMLNLIRYYYVIPFALSTALLYIFRTTISNLLLYIVEIDVNHYLYDICSVLVKTGLLVIWVVFYFYFCGARRYTYTTERNYYKDRAKYKKPYHYLINYFKDAEPHKLDTKTLPKVSWKETTGLVFGRTKEKRLITLPSSSEINIAVVGPPGSGKTSGIAIPNALQFGGSVLAIDIKGDLYNYNKDKRKIIKFCPDMPDAIHTSCKFNPFFGITKMTLTEKKLYLDSLATILIPDEGGSEGNYFSTRARKFFQGITYLLLHNDENASFPDVIHAILKGNPFDFVMESMKSDCELSKEFLSSFYGNNEKNISGVYDTLTTNLLIFSNPILDVLLGNSENSISIDTLENGYDIYLQISQENLDSYSPLFTLILQQFSMAFTKRPDSSTGVKNKPILMLLDEFPQLSFSYKMINTNLSTLRSKNVITLLIMQNLSQLEHKYGQSGARSILGNCHCQIMLGSNDIASSKYFSEMFGTKKVLKVSSSSSGNFGSNRNSTVQETRELVFQPEDFGDLPSKEIMILYLKGKYCKCSRLNCYIDKKVLNKN